jgi:hypothetical protein
MAKFLAMRRAGAVKSFGPGTSFPEELDPFSKALVNPLSGREQLSEDLGRIGSQRE